MKLGNNLYLTLILSFSLIFFKFSMAEDKITSTPLINIEEIKPSFEDSDEQGEVDYSSQNLKERKDFLN